MSIPYSVPGVGQTWAPHIPSLPSTQDQSALIAALREQSEAVRALAEQTGRLADVTAELVAYIGANLQPDDSHRAESHDVL